MHGSTAIVPRLALSLALLVAACDKGKTPTTDPGASTPATGDAPADSLAGREVVKNVDAEPGDVTTCPYSGRTFEVKPDHPRVAYQGNSYWICSEKAAEAVRADPGKYLDDFEG